jgi:uncharacterized protein (TIRG00374 family)
MAAKRKRTPRELTRRTLAIIVAAGFTALALWISLKGVDWAEVGKALAGADYLLVATAVAISLFGVSVLGWRWRILLAPRIRPSLGRLYRWNVLSQFANIVIPARTNELLRVWLTSVEGGTAAGFALGTIAVERVFDFAVFAAALIAGPAVFGLGKGIFPPAAGFAVGALALASLAMLVGLVVRPAVFLKMAEIVSRILPSPWRAKVNAFLGHAADAFTPLRDVRVAAAVFLYTAFLLFLQLVMMVVMFRAFHLDLLFGAALFTTFARSIANIPPAAPGRIGIFEVSIIAALAAFGIPRSEALGLAIVLHLVAHIPRIALGAIFLSVEPVPIFAPSRVMKDIGAYRDADAGGGLRPEGDPPRPEPIP